MGRTSVIETAAKFSLRPKLLFWLEYEKKLCFIFHSLQYQVKSLAAKDRSTEVMVKVAQVAATNVNTYVITTSTTIHHDFQYLL